MADGVAITAGAGTTIATDDIGGTQYQRIKMAFGIDGAAADVSASDPMPVTAPAATRTSHSIAVALQSDAIMNALTTMTPKFFTETVASADTDEELVALVSSKKIRVLALAVQCGSVATDVTFESSTTTRIHKVSAGANGGQILPFNPVGWFETASGASLTATTSAGSSVEITGVYVEV